MDDNERRMRVEKETVFLPSFLELPRHIRETIIRNDMLSFVLRLPALNIHTTDTIYK